MNMPRLAIEARIKAESMEESGKKEAIERTAKELFIQSVHQTAELIAEQLYSRYQYQRTALARQFPFMMGNDVWKGGGKLASQRPGGRCITTRNTRHWIYRRAQCHDGTLR